MKYLVLFLLCLNLFSCNKDKAGGEEQAKHYTIRNAIDLRRVFITVSQNTYLLPKDSCVKILKEQFETLKIVAKDDDSWFFKDDIVLCDSFKKFRKNNEKSPPECALGYLNVVNLDRYVENFAVKSMTSPANNCRRLDQLSIKK